MKLLAFLFALVPMFASFAEDGFQPLFNGKDLSGWDYDPALWRVQDGVIVGTSEPGKPKSNSFLIWNGTVQDFELKAVIRVTGDNNSGIQYRSRRLTEISPWTIAGYQCDVHPTPVHTAMTYEERGRGIFGYNGMDVVLDPDGQRWLIGERAPVEIDVAQWNEFRILAKGNRLEHRVNGQLTASLVDHDAKNRALEGLIAIQLHAGNPNTAEIREIHLKVLPREEPEPFQTLPSTAKKIEKPKVVSAQGKTAPAKQ
jgi:hypothetical protein